MAKGNARQVPPTKSSPISNLVICSVLMIVLPVTGFFVSKGYIFESALGYPDGSVGAAIVAVALVHIIIAGFIYAAWNEGSTKID